jgi:hypothetical protein
MIIDTIKFELAKLNAGRFKQQVEVHHKDLPQIIVQSYATSDILLDSDEEDKQDEVH